MIIDLDQNVKTSYDGKSTVRLGEIFKNSLFQGGDLEKGQELYDKISKGGEVDLKVEELSTLQNAVKKIYIPGIYWQVENIING